MFPRQTKQAATTALDTRSCFLLIATYLRQSLIAVVLIREPMPRDVLKECGWRHSGAIPDMREQILSVGVLRIRLRYAKLSNLMQNRRALYMRHLDICVRIPRIMLEPCSCVRMAHLMKAMLH